MLDALLILLGLLTSSLSSHGDCYPFLPFVSYFIS